MERQSFRFIRHAKLWYRESGVFDPATPSQARSESTIMLSEEFWNEIQENPIPVDLTIVKALADSPGNPALYVWLVWRCWTAKGPATMPLFEQECLISQLGNSANLRERDFHRQILEWLKAIRELWPECPASLLESGTCLLVRPIKSVPDFPQ
jgi:Plasmid encoded RepA protein